MSVDSGRRLLLVTPWLPFPPVGGFDTRNYQIIRHLARRHRVSVLSYGRREQIEAAAGLRDLCEAVYTVPQAPPRGLKKRWMQAMTTATAISYQWASLRSRRMQNAIRRLLPRQRFDVIQVEGSRMANFAFDRSSPVVLDAHDIEHERLYRMSQGERGWTRRLYNWVEHIKVRREELRAWTRMDGCIVPSDREREILRRALPLTPLAVAANGVDTDFFRPTPTPSGRNLVYTGLMSYRPNADAAIHFVEDVLPSILRVYPDVTFTIVGAGAQEDVLRLAGPSVAVTGRVEDVRPYVAQAAVFVVPLRMGSGTRLKVVEGLAMGKPMVSTTLGSEGIAVRDGEHLLIADDPSSFARAVLRLLEDRTLAASLAESGRRLVERAYDWSNVVDQIDAFHGEVLARQ